MVAVERADEIDGVGIVIAPSSTKLYNHKNIDSRWNTLYTHQDRERTAEQFFHDLGVGIEYFSDCQYFCGYTAWWRTVR